MVYEGLQRSGNIGKRTADFANGPCSGRCDKLQNVPFIHDTQSDWENICKLQLAIIGLVGLYYR
jgi:hypothetical protein